MGDTWPLSSIRWQSNSVIANLGNLDDVEIAAHIGRHRLAGDDGTLQVRVSARFELDVARSGDMGVDLRRL
ncbi:hypothetical protein PPNSA23_10160 [Phyllobacterium phragmitis]|uniref:Uncharacterized protein n=1 Tax=Phyllobacterium phragmitis TaxID=2670329 RepID=A0ABQ0GWQ1_9HYPH